MSEERGAQKVREGVVVSDRMAKTIVVEIQRRVQHKQYKKFIRTRRRFKVHDENNECKTGDLVRITETRPLSRDKRWRLLTVLERAKV